VLAQHPQQRRIRLGRYAHRIAIDRQRDRHASLLGTRFSRFPANVWRAREPPYAAPVREPHVEMARPLSPPREASPSLRILVWKDYRHENLALAAPRATKSLKVRFLGLGTWATSVGPFVRDRLATAPVSRTSIRAAPPWRSAASCSAPLRSGLRRSSCGLPMSALRQRVLAHVPGPAVSLGVGTHRDEGTRGCGARPPGHPGRAVLRRRPVLLAPGDPRHHGRQCDLPRHDRAGMGRNRRVAAHPRNHRAAHDSRARPVPVGRSGAARPDLWLCAGAPARRSVRPRDRGVLRRLRARGTRRHDSGTDPAA